MLERLPLGQRVVCEADRIFLAGVRGHGRAPGAYRRVPNWIGPPGCPLDAACFVPISAEQLPQAMSAWKQYIHAQAPDRLLQLAILHAAHEARPTVSAALGHGVPDIARVETAA